MMLARLRIRLLTAAWRLGGWLAERRRPRHDPVSARRWLWRDQTRSMGLSLDTVRERLRPRWVRLAARDGSETTSADRTPQQ